MTGTSEWDALGPPRGLRWTFDVTTRELPDGRTKIVGVRKGYDAERRLTLWHNDPELREAWKASARTGHRDAQIIPWEEEYWTPGPDAARLWQEMLDGELEVDDSADEWVP